MEYMAEQLCHEDGDIFERCFLGHVKVLSEMAKTPTTKFIHELPDIIEIIDKMRRSGRYRDKFMKRVEGEWHQCFAYLFHEVNKSFVEPFFSNQKMPSKRKIAEPNQPGAAVDPKMLEIDSKQPTNQENESRQSSERKNLIVETNTVVQQIQGASTNNEVCYFFSSSFFIFHFFFKLFL